MVDIVGEELYGIIGAVVAGAIFVIIKLKNVFKPANTVSDQVNDIRALVNEKLNYQSKVLDEKFNNIGDGIERLEEKVNYVNNNVEGKIRDIDAKVSGIDKRFEKLQDRFIDHINKGDR